MAGLVRPRSWQSAARRIRGFRLAASGSNGRLTMRVALDIVALIVLPAALVAAAPAWAEPDTPKQTTPRAPPSDTDPLKRVQDDLDRSKREAERLKAIQTQRE